MIALSSQLFVLPAVLLLLFISCAAAQKCTLLGARAADAATAASNVDPQVATQAYAAQTALSFTLQAKDLPVKRPQQSWPFKAFSTAVDAPYPTTDSATGVTYAKVRHATIQNITTSMLVFWFNQDLERQLPYLDASQGDFSLHLMWHPRDHCHQKVDSSDKTLWQLQEFLMASKNFTRSQRVGFQSPSQAQTNVQARLKWLNATGMSLEVQVLGQAVTTLVHTWADKAGGVDLLSEFWVGNPSYGPAFNRLINCGFARTGQDPLVVANKWQRHAVQEFGNLEQVLPYVYSKLG